ncbi:MAG: hypothetical protein SF123_26690 [Chloroflexota bacterium]|nr:hypothetical protein [Chloroflexota bacterium]
MTVLRMGKQAKAQKRTPYYDRFVLSLLTRFLHPEVSVARFCFWRARLPGLPGRFPGASGMVWCTIFSDAMQHRCRIATVRWLQQFGDVHTVSGAYVILAPHSGAGSEGNMTVSAGH